VAAEVLEEVGLEPIEARRNLIVRGVDLDALRGRRFRVGAVQCLGQRRCEPCAHLERLHAPASCARSRTAAACGPTSCAAATCAWAIRSRRWSDAALGARGRGARVVALVHGVMALAQTWWRVGPALAQRGWSVAAVDLPGHAGDVRRDGALDLDALVDGVAARLDGPVDLLVGTASGRSSRSGCGRDAGAARRWCSRSRRASVPSTWARWRR
jgi:hypothetical protein